MNTISIDLRTRPHVLGRGPAFTVEASDLGLNSWPEVLALTGRERTVLFDKDSVERDERENETLSVLYRERCSSCYVGDFDGHTCPAFGGPEPFSLRVWND